jgi:quercetin dioxygenase-like cupin family protein
MSYVRRACRLLPAVALLALLPAAAPAQEAQRPLAAEAQLAVRTLVATGTTVTGEPIRYPGGAPARVTMVEIVIAPGQQTGWHMHPVPLAAFILDGELTVDYGPKGKRTYRTGDAFVEAMNEAHDGRAGDGGPVRILGVIIGAEGVAVSVPAAAPAR